MYCEFLRLVVVEMSELMPMSGCRQYIWVMSFTKKTPIDPSLWVTHIEAPKTTSDAFSLTLHKIAIQTLKKLPLKTHLQEGQNLKLYSNMHPFLLISDKNCFSI